MAKILMPASLTAAVILTASGTPAEAKRLCSEHSKVIGQFAKVYDENPVAGGLTRDGRLLQILSTGDGATWTIVISKPDGETCVMMAGEAWRKLKVKDPEQEPNT